ncbi:hypothetical protein AUC68_01515 [Methyloceanibacter methanicus]|uniref:HPr kinase/phosphorylase C-terminal domain-containing protein n=1 Tax=Methyloceanibacter methanicus TaxID=1774968 RepID=A0A1E3W217_9HYPH|nr:hypothetical protein AUC68_01515 [Methyloceanibacter methanicus]
MLRGKSGSGKSDLALRFLALPDGDAGPARLVADDQVCLDATGEGVTASPPANLAGLIEVRGLGIQPVSSIPAARLVLVCDLVAAAEVPRMLPDPWPRTRLAGIALPVLKLAPFEASAPLKLRMAIVAATAHLREAEQ